MFYSGAFETFEPHHRLIQRCFHHCRHHYYYNTLQYHYTAIPPIQLLFCASGPRRVYKYAHVHRACPVDLSFVRANGSRRPFRNKNLKPCLHPRRLSSGHMPRMYIYIYSKRTTESITTTPFPLLITLTHTHIYNIHVYLCVNYIYICIHNIYACKRCHARILPGFGFRLI